MGGLSLCHSCPVKGSGIFSSLSGDELQKIREFAHHGCYKRRQIIFHEDNPCQGFYIVRSGKAKLIKSSRTGRQQIIKLVKPSEMMGEDAVFGNCNYAFTAEAMEDSEICFISKAEFLGFLRNKPDIAIKLVNILSGELRSARSQIIDMALKDARERMANLILNLAEDYGASSEQGVRLGLTLTRNEIAEMVGISQETAIRLLSEFKDTGLIDTYRRHITILDRDGVRGIAHGDQGY